VLGVAVPDTKPEEDKRDGLPSGPVIAKQHFILLMTVMMQRATEPESLSLSCNQNLLSLEVNDIVTHLRNVRMDLH
jgi:hypothetical protein